MDLLIPNAELDAARSARPGDGLEAPPPRMDFAEHIRTVLAEADALQKRAEHEAGQLAAGEGSTVETMIALSRADLSLRFVVALRDRALAAFEDLMRMQV